MSLASWLRRNARIVSSTSSGLSSTSRISTSCDMHLLLERRSACLLARLALGCAQREEKCRPMIDFSGDPNPATVLPNDALHKRQADSSTLEIARRVQPVKDSKKLSRIPHVETHPVVPDENHPLVVLVDPSHLDHGMFPPARVLHSIREQVHEYLFHQSGIAFGAEQGSDLPLHLPAGTLRSKIVNCLA